MNLERFISSGDSDKYSAGHWLMHSLHSDLRSNGITVFQNTLSNNAAQILFQSKRHERHEKDEAV